MNNSSRVGISELILVFGFIPLVVVSEVIVVDSISS